MTTFPTVVADFLAESEPLDRLLAGLTPRQWRLDSPAPGWTVRHQVAHLTSVFGLAAMAAGTPDRFTVLLSRLTDDVDANIAAALAPYLPLEPAALLDRWRAQRIASCEAIAAGPLDRTVPWLVGPLPAGLLASAGILELFAHGQDIADSVGARPEHSDRMRHLVESAIRNWDVAYQANGETAPAQQFRFELTAPSGALWTFGPEDAAETIAGPAVDFGLLTTRRRHRADLAIRASGPASDHWLDIAQAYRGPAGAGRRPGQFAHAG